MQNGVVLISIAAILTLVLTNGDTRVLVLMYSINVFLTFSLSQMGMVRYWMKNRIKYPGWVRHITIHTIGLVLCVSILIMNLIEKFVEGGWVTILITGVLIALCMFIKRRYEASNRNLSRLDEVLKDIPVDASTNTPKELNPKSPTAVVLVNSFGGLGIHTFFSIQKLFPKHFKNFIFVSITVFDAGNLKGAGELDEAVAKTKKSLEQFVEFAQRFGFPAEYRMSSGTEVLAEAEKISIEIAKEYPLSVFFASKLIFQRERWYHRFLHNETAQQFQRRVQFAGLNSMVLPIRIFTNQH